jgi:hypothetical protein
MSRRQERRLLQHCNRALIAALSLLGLSLDGLHAADAILQMAALVWLWAPELQLYEVQCLDLVRDRRRPRCRFLLTPSREDEPVPAESNYE